MVGDGHGQPADLGLPQEGPARRRLEDLHAGAEFRGHAPSMRRHAPPSQGRRSPRERAGWLSPPGTPGGSRWRRGPVGGRQAFGVLRWWTTPSTTSTSMRPAATKATTAAMPAIRPTVDQAKVESSSPRSVSPLKRVLRCPVMVVASSCSAAISASRRPAVLGRLRRRRWRRARGRRGRRRWRRRRCRPGGRRCSWRRPRPPSRCSPAGRRSPTRSVRPWSTRAASSGKTMFWEESSRST